MGQGLLLRSQGLVTTTTTTTRHLMTATEHGSTLNRSEVEGGCELGQETALGE